MNYPLKQNIVANYASQIYVTAVGILILPLYIKYMGAEAYGLVGFFTMLQTWFALLDVGLTPTIGRETARYNGGAMSALAYRQFFRALNIIFAGIAVIGGGGLWLLSDFIVAHWLNVAELPLDDVVLAVEIMAFSVALRWTGGLYRGVIAGFESLVWLSGFNALAATVRFLGVFLSMWLFGFTPFVFFMYQLVVALVELILVFIKAKKLLPRVDAAEAIGWSFRPVSSVIRFSLTIAFISSVWIFVTQADKLVLSGILSLEEYGYFTLSVLVASGVIVAASPIGMAVMPTMARLRAEGNNQEMMKVYHNATRLVSLIGGCGAIVLSLCAKPLTMLWIGDAEISTKITPIIQLYAAGNGFLVVAALPYYLQYSLGDLRCHVIGSLGLAFLLLPLQVIAANEFGAVGAGVVWVSMNALFLLVWVAYTHRKLIPGIHFSWLYRNVLLIVLPALSISALLAILDVGFVTRIDAALIVVSYSFGIMGISLMTYLLLRRLANELR